MATLTAPAHLSIRDLVAGYPGNMILDHIGFEIPNGQRVAVVGPNGAGKSTLFKALVGLLPALEGQIYVHGLRLGAHQDCVAYVPQREEVDWRFPVTVFDVVMMGRYGRLGLFRRPDRADEDAVNRCLQQLNILSLARQPIGGLSGGQQQRVFLARALAQDPHILLMDEPFTGIDATTQETIFSVLDELRKQGVTTLVSTHDLNMAAQRFDQVILLNKRLVAFGPPEQALTEATIRSAFGGQVLNLAGGLIVDECCPGDADHSHE